MAVISFKCPNCDGELIFDPGTQNYKCEYCNSIFSQGELEAMKPAFATEQQVTEDLQEDGTDVPDGEAVRYTCPSCGAEIITDDTTAATFCYYCQNPVVLGGKLEGSFLPDRIIPFSVPQKVAIAGFLDYVGKKKFVPKAFFDPKQSERGDRVSQANGVYFPYWLYDVELEGSIQGEARHVRVWRVGDNEYTETKFYAIERGGDVRLSNLGENALQKANVKLARGVMPYDFKLTKDFHTGYLSGFMAERRDIEQSAVQGKMQTVMRESAEKLLRETVTGFSSVSVKNSNFRPKSERWSYVLLPVWTITYKGRNGKVYYYSMNGQTGKVCGELPVDNVKLGIVSALVGLGVLILGLIGGFLT